MIRALISILLGILLVTGCSSNEGKTTQSNKVEEKEAADPSLITLKPESQKLANIEIGSLTYSSFRVSMQFPGTIKANEDRVTHIGPRVAGRVVDVKATLGDRVQKGQKLAIIDSVELGKTQSEYLAARAKLIVAEKAYERAKTLLQGKVIGTGEYQRREGDYLSGKADTEAFEDQLHLLGMTQNEIERLAAEKELNSQIAIASPIDGTIIERHITRGELVEPSASVYTVADLSTIWGIAEVPEQDIARVRKEMPVEVHVSSYPQETYKGTITYVSETLDADSRTVKVRVEIDNSHRELKPEMFATFRIASEGSERVLALPESAMQRDGNETVVYVPSDGGFRKKVVKVGRELDGHHEILAGLKEGEKVVIKGAFILKSEELKGQMEED